MYDPMTYHMLADGIAKTSGVASAPFINDPANASI